jgi:NAD(P)-binding Rossmann-like domain
LAKTGVDRWKHKNMISRPLFFFFFSFSHRITRDRSGSEQVVDRYAYLCEPCSAPVWLAPRHAIVLSHNAASPLRPLLPPSYPHPPLLPLCTKAHFLTLYVFSSLIASSHLYPISSCLVQRRSHESAKKASLQIRFVIVGGGPAGLACAVALRRVGHHVILLEKGPDFIGVRTIPVYFKLPR